MIKENDFVELVYTGRIKESNQIFDTNDINIAKKENLYDPKQKYNPHIICVGHKDVVQGLDNALVGKEPDKVFTVEVTPEQGFGKRDAQLFQLVPASSFREQKIQPVPGLQVTINNMPGTIKTVSGGRILVDFNHILAGKTLVYEATVKSVITDTKQKIEGYLKLLLNAPKVEAKVENNNAEIKLEIPEKFQEMVISEMKARLPELKEIKFVK
tara:strand:- start:3081 stop:3719 length:639 start_codon:yes stop_codon:yes gene_type:complete